MAERTYSEREIAAIIRRTAERQRLAPSRDDASGLTLAEIERVGREAGFDPALLRAAAAELDAGILLPESDTDRVSVGERWVNAPLEPGVWEDAVAALRVRFGPTGAWSWSAPPSDTTRVGAGQEWSHADSSGLQSTVSVSPRGDRTRVRVVQVDGGFDINTRTQAALFAGFFGLIPAMLIGALLAETLGMGDLVGVAAVLVVLALSAGPGGALMDRRASRARARRRARQSEEVQQLADDLAHRLAAETAGPGLPAGGEVDAGQEPQAGDMEAPAPGAPVGPRLDLSVLDAEAEPPNAAPVRDQRARA